MTFSLVACDLEARQWGVAVASKFPSVGAVVPWARGDVGAVATQAWANVSYGPEGLELLSNGSDAEAAMAALVEADEGRDQRQLGLVDRHGGAATYTGAECSDWAGGRTGPCFAAQGNILAGAQVVDALADSFTSSDGPLAHRLAAALLAADRAGGDRRGRQSACLMVRQAGGGYGGNNDILIDLRVDDHTDPVPEIGRLLGIHELLFGKTPSEQFLPLKGPLADEVQERLGTLGFASLDEWSGMENLEERLDPAGTSIDPELLKMLRSQSG